MALTDCPECKSSVSTHAVSCPGCGYPIASMRGAGPASMLSDRPLPQQPQIVTLAKSRGTYIILGLLFGGLGLNNFYAGYNGRGAVKLAILCLPLMLDAVSDFRTGFTIIGLAINGLWTLIEVFTVKTDAAGDTMS